MTFCTKPATPPSRRNHQNDRIECSHGRTIRLFVANQPAEGRKYLVEIKKDSTFDAGGMAEWSIAAVLKAVELRGSGGSNPSPSAKFCEDFAKYDDKTFAVLSFFL